MTASELVLPVLGALVPFVCFIAVGLLGMSMLHMIGKSG